MQTVVMYHTRCFDGTMAAAAALKAIKDGTLDCDPEKGLIPINYNQSAPDDFFKEDGPYQEAMETSPARFIFLDFCPKANTVKGLLDYGHEVVVLDHHKTAKADASELEGIPGLDLRFDMTQSGARMAWEYFHGEAPMLALYVEDRDLWKWKLPNTREVIAWMSASAETNNPQSYLDAEESFDSDAGRAAMSVGTFLCAEMDTQIQKMASAYRYVEIQGFGRGIIVNATCYPSEVGQYLYDRHDVPYVIAYNVTRGGDFALSFRSKPGAAHSIDVTRLAAVFDGGGHANAAGGICNMEEWVDLLHGSSHQDKALAKQGL